jgi:hypothetical protein
MRGKKSPTATPSCSACSVMSNGRASKQLLSLLPGSSPDVVIRTAPYLRTLHRHPLRRAALFSSHRWWPRCHNTQEFLGSEYDERQEGITFSNFTSSWTTGRRSDAEPRKLRLDGSGYFHPGCCPALRPLRHSGEQDGTWRYLKSLLATAPWGRLVGRVPGGSSCGGL